MNLIKIGLLAAMSSASAFPQSTPLASPDVSLAPGQTNLDRLSEVRGLRSGFIERLDDVLYAGGQRYRVRFDGSGFEFLPAFGGRAERLHPVRFQVESVRREGGQPIAAAAVEPQASDMQIVHKRQDYVEKYDVCTHAISQSFTFGKLPSGHGDLIVRGRLDTDLDVTVAKDGGLSLSLAGFGSMSFGGVTGIDADGARATGALRYEAGVLELSLPAEFVAQAALPLLLDPIIGSIVQVESTTDDEGNRASVAYNSSNDVYCVVWEEQFSFTRTEVRARLIDGSTGNPIDSERFVTANLGINQRPSVGNSELQDRFLIAWADDRNGGRDIYGRSMSASDGSFGTVTALRSEPGVESSPAVGGAINSSIVFVVYDDETEDDIEGVPVTLLANGNLSLGTPINIQDVGDGYGNPAISKSAGPGSRHMVVWTKATGIGNTDIQGRLISLGGQLSGAIFDVTTTSNDEDGPSVDGDGSNWIIAYETEAVAGAGNNDIACRTAVFINGSLFVGNEVLIESDIEEERDAHVAWCGDSVLVVYDDESAAGDFDPRINVIDPFSAEYVGIQVPLNQQSPLQSIRTAIASKFSASGDRADSEAFVAWEDIVPPDGGTISGRRFRSDDGVVTELANQCGANGGEARAPNASVGNQAFRLRLFGATNSSPTALLLSFDRINATCGACTIVPDPFTGFSFVAMTNPFGNASLEFPIPSDSGLDGLRFYAQWITVDAGAPACNLFNSDLSSAISVEVQ